MECLRSRPRPPATTLRSTRWTGRRVVHAAERVHRPGVDDRVATWSGFHAIGAPGFEPGTSPTRTVRATRLRHAPRGVIISERRVGRGEGRSPLLWTGRRFQAMKMARRLIPILVVLLLATVPAGAHAYLPPG